MLERLDTDRARRFWGRIKVLRCIVAYAIWWVRWRDPPTGKRWAEEQIARALVSR